MGYNLCHIWSLHKNPRMLVWLNYALLSSIQLLWKYNLHDILLVFLELYNIIEQSPRNIWINKYYFLIATMLLSSGISFSVYENWRPGCTVTVKTKKMLTRDMALGLMEQPLLGLKWIGIKLNSKQKLR